MKSSPANDISPLCPNVSSTTNDTKSEFTSSNVSHITNDTKSTEFTSCLTCLGHVWAVESTGDRLDLPAVAVVCTGWTECVPRLSSGWRISRADPSSIWPCSSLAELRWCLSGQYWSFHCEGNNISSSESTVDLTERNACRTTRVNSEWMRLSDPVHSCFFIIFQN